MKSINVLTKGILSLWLILCSISCNQIELEPKASLDVPLLGLMSSRQTGITFKNTSVETPQRHLAHYDYFYNGSGVAIGDINNDGLADIFFAGNDAPNELYLNKGELQFNNISKTAGITSNKWATGVSLVDINKDGWLDIYVCNSGPYASEKALANELYINNGDLTFTESAARYGIADASYSSQASFFDMDKDGDLDLFVMNHSLIGYGKDLVDWEKGFDAQEEDIQKKSCSTLYRNNGDGSFTDITKEAGIYRPGFGLGISVTDFDENGFLDIYVANDYFIPDFLFFNLGDGKFVENIKARATHTSFFSMGCDAADFNNDGLIDLAVVDMTPTDHYRSKTLMESMDVNKFRYLVQKKGYVPQYMFNSLNLNRSKGNFSEIGHQAGVAQTDWSWAPLLADLDNDTWKDLLVTNGFKRDTKDRDWAQKLQDAFDREDVTEEEIFEVIQSAKSTPMVNFLFKNNGDLSFKDTSKNWGFTETSFSQGAAYGDLDNDGDLDLVINNLEKEAFVYRNNSETLSGNNYIQFVLQAANDKSELLNSKISITTGDKTQTIEYNFVRGYLSTMQPLAHFGLGSENTVDRVDFHWPDGTRSTIDNPEVNTRHTVDRSKLSTKTLLPDEDSLPFMDIAHRVGLGSYKHEENPFDDYEKEILLPHKQSTLGPALAVGDVNGDGYDDFYAGGSKGQAGSLYFQDLKKGFIKAAATAFRTDAKYEDLGAHFFDADSDGDLDLYVASGGGGDVVDTSSLLLDRLYTNNGSGQFTAARDMLPEIASSTSWVSAHDWDTDGDMDLFVGGRNSPGKYPLPPNSYLLENVNGKFIDITGSIAPDLAKAGMITSTSWSDLNGDNVKDLIVVGEWMPVTIFLNTGSGFINNTDAYGLGNETGWWYSIKNGDFDNDGDQDFVLGNVGLNNKFHPMPEKPLHIFSNDFDDNGTLDIVLSKEYKGSLAPIRGKECSTQQMPFISEKFPMFSDFASSSLEDIYGEENLKSALHYTATKFESVYMENKGNGSFSFTPLPPEAQMAPINDMVVADFDKDGNLDLVIGGNKLHTEVETTSYDAGKGLFLRGKGDGSFEAYTKIEDSGIFMPDNVRQLELMRIFREKRPAVLVANNDGKLHLFAWTR